MSSDASHTPAALARLVLSDRARDVVDDALRLVPTLDDGQRPPGDLLLEALQVRAQVDKLVTAAVLNARERGADWSDIALLVGIRTRSVTERWLPDEQRWHAGLAQPLRQEPGEELPQLAVAQAAYAPEVYARDLDAWASRHVDEIEYGRWRQLGKDPRRPVSGGLEPGSLGTGGADEPKEPPGAGEDG
ncbi:hypothetical protein [Streptomyces sp. NPDC049916]|uniref:hypothetical protein n=1 Tax=Streptomyces sp. NPDC049916 TaxID=3155156 RepID=UPI00342F8E12